MADPRELTQEEKVRALEKIREALGTSRQGLDAGSPDAGPQGYHDGRWAFGSPGGGGRFNWNGGYTTEYPPEPDAGTPDAGSGRPRWARDAGEIDTGNKLMGPSEGGGAGTMDEEQMEAKRKALEEFRDYAKKMRGERLRARVNPKDDDLADRVMGATAAGVPGTDGPDGGADAGEGEAQGDLADRVMNATMAGVPRSELDPDNLPSGQVDDQTDRDGGELADSKPKGGSGAADAGHSRVDVTVDRPSVERRVGKVPTVDVGVVKVRRSAPAHDMDEATKAEFKRLMDKVEAEKGPVDKIRDLFAPVREALGIDQPSAPPRKDVSAGGEDMTDEELEELRKAAE